jgi:hypothetical protein
MIAGIISFVVLALAVAAGIWISRTFFGGKIAS